MKEKVERGSWKQWLADSNATEGKRSKYTLKNGQLLINIHIISATLDE